MVKNNTTLGASGNMGYRIAQDNSDNAWLDFRTNATDGAKSFSFRMQDDTNTASVSNLLVLNKDTGNFTMVYGATVSGRMKASQYYVNKPDTRTPISAGIYLGQDNSTVAYFKINMGTGSGGFNFLTLDQNGLNPTTNLSLKPSGVAQIPYYSQTTNAQDTESTAMAMWDMQGNLIRGYNNNQRIRSVESAVSSIESSVVATVPIKVNEVIQRLNTLKIWNTKIADLTMNLPPPQFTPVPVAGATQIQLALSVPLSIAQDPTWQASYISSLAAVLGISASRIVITAVSGTAQVLTVAKPMYQANYTSGSLAVYITQAIGVPPANSNEPSSDFVSSLLIQQAENPQSPLNQLFRQNNNGSDVIDTTYIPTQNHVDVMPTAIPTTPPVQTYTNYSLSNGTYTNTVNGALAGTWTPPINCKILSVVIDISGQTNGGGFGLFSIWTASLTVLNGYYPSDASVNIVEHSLPLANFSKTTFSAGETMTFYFTTLSGGRPFITRILNDGTYGTLALKITYQAN